MCSGESWHSHIHREQLISRVWPESLMLLKYKCYHVAVEYGERKKSCITNQLHLHYYNIYLFIFFRKSVNAFYLLSMYTICKIFWRVCDHVALVSNILSHAY